MNGESVADYTDRPYALGLYEKAMPPQLPWKEKLQSAKQAGYDYIELSIDEAEEKIRRLVMTKEERLRLISAMYETGLPVRSMCVSTLTKYSLGNDNPAYCARGIEILRGAVKLADDLVRSSGTIAQGFNRTVITLIPAVDILSVPLLFYKETFTFWLFRI